MNEKTAKPNWWPRNPYPESIFTMSEEQYPEIVPDPKLRTTLSGMLGRRFWDIASDAIWAAMLEAEDNSWASAWKRVAKKWRSYALILVEEVIENE